MTENYTEMFFSKQFEDLYAKMDSVMHHRIGGIENLEAFYKKVLAFTGDSLEIVTVDTSISGDLFLSNQEATGSKGAIVQIAWAVANNGLIKGFSIRPKRTEAPSKYLDYQPKTKLNLPFKGSWTVFSGGRTLATNHHAAAKNQHFANDMAIAIDGKTHRDEGTQLTDYYVWGSQVLAPAAGVIVQLVDSLPDNPISTTDTKNVAGNYLIIDHENGEYSFMAHFQSKSIKVILGDKVVTGQLLGLVGNSGNTSEPHLHYHLQDSPYFPETECIPATFYNYFADGKWTVSGELQQGQKVRNEE